jgi:hypothetical protein
VDVLPLVIGPLAILLGLAGLTGLLDDSRLRLYRSNRPVALGEKHARLQRNGGTMLVIVGGLFLFLGLRG